MVADVAFTSIDFFFFFSKKKHPIPGKWERTKAQSHNWTILNQLVYVISDFFVLLQIIINFRMNVSMNANANAISTLSHRHVQQFFSWYAIGNDIFKFEAAA